MTERRDSERVLLSIPIRVSFFGRGETSFAEETKTVEINRKGARIVLKHPVNPDDTLRIVNLENLREADFRVLGPSRLEEGGVCEWGVECLETAREIWEIQFSPPLEQAGKQAGALLECSECRTQIFTALQSWEVDALDEGSLQRLCQDCGGPTDWRYVDVNLRARERERAAPEAVAASPETPGWVPSVVPQPAQPERRSSRRLALKLPILVRTKAGDQEITKTENISKGGLAVCLGIELEVGDTITVCCPYEEGGQNLEQKAIIRHRETFFVGQRWLYGVQILS